MMKFKVIREHLGDKFYRAGDVREVNEHDVKHLIKAGVLVEDSVPLVSETVGADISTEPDENKSGLPAVELVGDHGAHGDNHSLRQDDIMADQQSEQVKKEPEHKNKAEPVVPQNKAK